MTTRSRQAASLLVALALAACEGALEHPERFDYLFDAGPVSIEPPDAGEPTDAGDDRDAGRDAGAPDAGGTTSPDAGTPEDPCDDVPRLILRPSCASGPCHSEATARADLDLESPGLTDRLWDMPSAYGDSLLIDPDVPRRSLLYRKLLSPPPYGFVMPMSAPPLPPAQITCLLEWIEDGARAP